jgi:uncharacterized repeat protein (TIGR02543 family)
MMCFSILFSANIFKITLVKGYATWSIQSPTGIAVDGSGNVYVIDYNSSHVEKFTSGGVLLGQVDSGQLSHPFGIAVDGSGNVYVADTNNNRVVKFLTNSTVETWGSYGTGNGHFYGPAGIAVDGSGNVYVADLSNNRVEKFSSGGVYLGQFGSQGTGDGKFNGPYGIAVDGSGNVYVTDKGNDRVEKFLDDGTGTFPFQCQFGSYGNGDGQFIQPLGIAVDSSGYVYVADSLNDRIQKFYSPPPGLNYVFHAKWGSFGSGDYQFWTAHEVCVDSSGAVYVADFGNNRVQKFNQYTLTINKDDPSGDNNYNYVLPYEGQDTIVEGSTVAITAVATHGYVFTGWTGAVSGATNPATITMDGSKDVIAHFAYASVSVTPNLAHLGQVVQISGQVTPAAIYSLEIDFIDPNGDYQLLSFYSTDNAGQFLVSFTPPLPMLGPYYIEVNDIDDINNPVVLATTDFVVMEPGITVMNMVVGAAPPDAWNYLITDNEGAVLADFTLPADVGTTTFSGAPFESGGVFTLTATPKYGYETDISAQTSLGSSSEIDGLQTIIDLAPDGGALVIFTNAPEPSFLIAQLENLAPGEMTYSVPPFKVVPVQAAWNPDKNNDQTIDLVAGKPTAVLVNLAGVSSDVTLQLTFAETPPSSPPLPSPVDKGVTATDLAANSIVSFYPIVLDTTSTRTVTISVSYVAGTGTTIDSTTVTVRKTNDLSLYYGFMHKSGGGYLDPSSSNYTETVTKSNEFITSVYPVKTVLANAPSITSSQQIGGSNSMAKDCAAVAAKALTNKRAIGVAVTTSGYFSGFGKSGYVGVSYGPNCKGVIVAENYWTAASHEVGHTFNLYVKPTPEEYESYPLYGQKASGVSPGTGQWRAGQDFMGAAPYRSLDNTWVNSAGTYNPLFNALTLTLNDPEIVIVSGIFHRDTDTLELPFAWSRLEQGTPSQIVTGDYALKLIGDYGSQTVNFDVQFGFTASVGVTVGKNRPTDEGGLIDTDEAPFCFAAVLPAGTAEIQILDKTNPQQPEGVLKGTVEASEIVNVGVTEAYFTDSDYNPINSFECVFTPDKGTSYKMSATNPGTFRYNLKITNNDPTGTFTAAVSIPIDFVLKPLSPGANPVQINGQPVTYSFSGGVLTVPNILINQGQTKTLSVHLDYGLKFKYTSDQPYTSNSQTTWLKGYAFRATLNSFQTDTATIAAMGKKVTAIGGFLTDVNGVPKGGLTLEVTSGANVIGTSVASSDGFYFIAVPPGGPYTVRITNSLSTPVGPVTIVSVAKDQFVEKDFNTLSPADPAITGFVTDTSGNGVSGATVQLLNRQGKVLATTTTNLGGYYVFRFSQPGQYTVKITVPKGYTATATSTTLSVKQFETAKINFSLAAEK